MKLAGKVYRIEMLKDVCPVLRAGQVIRTEAIGIGTNWIKIPIPHCPAKTLFNFEAKWTLAD